MKSQTRQMLLNLATGAAIAAATALVLLPTMASAAPATATDSVNVRATPGGAVVSKLQAGESVEVSQCQGSWCYVSHPGPDGWVSAQYLAGVNQQPGVSFGFSIGPNGKPNVSVGVGTPPPVADEADDEDVSEVCFYDRSRMRGQSFCLEEGETTNNLRGWAERISSPASAGAAADA